MRIFLIHIFNISVMEYLEYAIKVIVGLSIMNVWLFRSSKATPWRGGDAGNMKQEFAVYGLPEWLMMVVGILKVILSVGLIASIWLPELESYSAYGIAALMLVAVVMHIKVGDPLKKSLPALTFLMLSVVTALI